MNFVFGFYLGKTLFLWIICVVSTCLCTYVVDDRAGMGRTFGGIGAISGGGVSFIFVTSAHLRTYLRVAVQNQTFSRGSRKWLVGEWQEIKDLSDRSHGYLSAIPTGARYTVP